MMKLTEIGPIPEDWEIIPIREAARFTRGISWRKNEEVGVGFGILVISIPNIKIGEIDFNSKFNHYINKAISDGKCLNIGDVVFVGSSGTLENIGRNAVLRESPFEKLAFASFTFKAKPNEAEIVPEFFYHILNSEYVPFDKYSKRASDGKFNFQLTDFLERLKIPKPPKSEQSKIANLLSLIQSAVKNQEELIHTSSELKNALMQQLFTEGTRGEKRKVTEIGLLPESWDVVELENLIVQMDYGTSVKCSYEESCAFPVLRIPNVVNGAIDINDLKFGKPKITEIEKLLLEKGDLLFVRTNGVKENAGRCALYQSELERAYFASYLIRVKVDSAKLLPSFLNIYAQTEAGKSYLSGRATRTADGKFNINTGTIRSVLIPVPTKSEQETIVNTIIAVSEKIDLHQAKKQSLTDLFKAMLHKLMTGEIRVKDLDLANLPVEQLNAQEALA